MACNRRLAEWLEMTDRDLRGLPYEQFVRDLAERGEYADEDKEAAIAARMSRIRAAPALRRPNAGARTDGSCRSPSTRCRRAAG